jgi:hypothetical protein
MLCRVELVRTDFEEERLGTIFKVTRIGGLYMVFLRSMLRLLVIAICPYLADSCHPDVGGDNFLRNVGSYKNHMA